MHAAAQRPDQVVEQGTGETGRYLSTATVRGVMEQSPAGPREVVEIIPPAHSATDRLRSAVVSALPTPGEVQRVDWRGDEEWVSTLPDPNDTTATETP